MWRAITKACIFCLSLSRWIIFSVLELAKFTLRCFLCGKLFWNSNNSQFERSNELDLKYEAPLRLQLVMYQFVRVNNCLAIQLLTLQ